MTNVQVQSTRDTRSGESSFAVLAGQLRRAGRSFWRGLREWCGDASYEKYMSASATQKSTCAKLTPAEFYVEQLNRRYSRPSRCC
jgi:uncharacterized short protein YbdD (DUF466 family)